MKKILLMGNPNVGKSVVFSRLTGVRVISSNYPGTTVEFTQGAMQMGNENAMLIDVPGIYGLEAACKAEEIAVAMLEESDTVIDVVDATNLERNLHLTLHLLEQNIPVIVALNIYDDAKHKGIHIDIAKMEAELGVPVVPTVAVTGEGIKELVSRLPEAANPRQAPRTEQERWTEVGRVVDAVQSLEHRHHTLLEWIGDASVKPVTGIPIALFILLTAFGLIRLFSEGLIRLVFEPVFETLWRPVVMRLDELLGPAGFLHTVLIGHLIDGQIDFIQSFGVLTTGLFVPVAMVFPYVVSFYLVLGLLEDSGYLPRLAVLLDALMHRMGLHGWAIIPMLLGFGCNVPGIIATRMLESRRERLIAATLVTIAVPCASLQAMIWGLLGARGPQYVALVYLILFAVWIVLGRILDGLLKGSSPELILEIPAYRIPSWQTVFQKLALRMRSFFREAAPIVLVGILAVNVLYFFGLFDALADFTAPVVTKLFGLPKQAVIALVIGFLRKDVAIGMLGTLDLTANQLVVSVVILSMSFPCVATFSILLKELGPRGFAFSLTIMLASATIVGTLLNLIL